MAKAGRSEMEQAALAHGKRWIVALTGASGMRYALRLMQRLIAAPQIRELDLVVSAAALRVLQEEEGIKLSRSRLSARTLIGRDSAKITVHQLNDIGASIASGSVPVDGMIVVPCSMSSLAAIATGVHSNLIHRAADVTLKERRPLVLAPRETPLSAIHLENMLKLARLGVAIVPAMPGFYTHPRSIEDLIDQQVTKLLDAMGIHDPKAKRWRSSR